MIGIILIAHAHIARETKVAVEHILGAQNAFEAVDIPNSDASKAEQRNFDTLIAKLDQGQGVLVLVDLFGATPCNIASGAEENRMLEVVAGFNVPAVIKAITLRQKHISLKELAKASIASGQQYMCLGSDIKHAGLSRP